MLSKILYILLALLILMVLITVHEFGHYIAGKIFKFKINEFAIGFGKPIYKKVKKSGEVFSVRILPLGGFCAFEGEDEDNPGKDAFNSKPAWQRLIVLFSGVFFNFIFGVLTSAIYLMVAGYGVPVISATRNEISAQNLLVGDKIIAVNNKTIEAYRPVNDILAKYAEDQTITLTIEREGQQFDLQINKVNSSTGYFYVADATNINNNLYKKVGDIYVKVELDEFRTTIMNAPVTEDEQKGTLPDLATTYYREVTGEDGVKAFKAYTFEDMVKDKVLVLSGKGLSLGIVYYQVGESYGFFESLLKAWPFAFYICGVILSALGGLFTGATTIAEMGGTLTTISVIAEYSAINPLVILYLFPMLSLNLAIFNILPIPALDGARMLFVLWEAITKKPVNRKVEGWIHTIGLFVLLGLVIFLDVYHIFIMPLLS